MEPLRNPLEAAAQLQGLLQAAGIESIVIGGLAAAIWGEPRATRDADLKVLLTREETARLLDCLPPDRYEMSSDSSEMLERLGFLFIRETGGARLDILLAENAFDVEAVRRSRRVEVLPDLTLTVCAPEDLIIYKMISTRARDHADVPGIFRRQRKTLDHDYVEGWLSQFELALDDSTLVRSYRRMRETAIDAGN